MPLWQWVVDAAGAVLLLVLLYGLCLVVRRRWISRHGGTFELLRPRPVRQGRARLGSGGGPLLRRRAGVLPDLLAAAAARAACSHRSDLEYLRGTREPVGAEAHSLVRRPRDRPCRTAAGPLELAMTADALTGFLAWLEAAPPGQRLRGR